MKSNKTDGKIVQNRNKIISEMRTGLFVSTDRSHFLIRDVRKILQQKFCTKAVSGPPLPTGNCEIFLQAINNPPSGVNFIGSKGVLEMYLNMLKESRANFAFEKRLEVITVEDEEEDVSSVANSDDATNDSLSVLIVDDSNLEKGLAKSSHVDVIDIDLCEVAESSQQSSSLSKDFKKDEGETGRCVVDLLPESSNEDISVEQSFTKLNTGFGDEVTVFDSVKKRDSSCPSFVNTNSSKSSQELSCGGVKRRKSVEIIEIEDDEIIVLDDSFQKPKHHKASSCLSSYQGIENLRVEQDSKIGVVTSSSQKNMFDLDYSGKIGSPLSFKRTDPLPKKSLYCNLISVLDPSSSDVFKKSNGNEISAENKSTFTNHAKKSSKFSYKRPAHLISPLIQNSLKQVPDSSSESSSGMSNIYNPNANLLEKRTGLRPIVIDGNNVGVSHGKGQFSVKGIQICINYFEKRGHRQIKAFIPQYRRKRDIHDILERMERQGTVVITPSRRVEGKIVAPYDDRYIVQYAAEVGGVIVTTDNYRDLMEENPGWKETIKNRMLMFSWVDDLLMFPQDPMGRNGPKLDDFLKFPD